MISEVQGLESLSRRALLLSYADSTVLRDVIERHNIRNPLALQHLDHAFLIISLAAGGGSLRRQQSLPRKLYPIDPGLIPPLRSQRSRQLRRCHGNRGDRGAQTPGCRTLVPAQRERPRSE